MSIIYEPKGKAGEYAKLAVNLFTGCSHKCKYCYCPAILRRSLEQWSESPQPRKDIIKLLEKDAKKLSGNPNPVLMCFMSDPYQSKAAAIITRQALDVLANNNLKANILTKGGMLVSRDFDFMAQNKVFFGSTIVFSDDSYRQEWEPGAAKIENRYEAVKLAHEMGIYTWVSLEPVIVPEQALQVIKELAPWVDYWKVGKLNHNKEIENKVDWRKFLQDVTELLVVLKAKYYIKKDLLAYK